MEKFHKWIELSGNGQNKSIFSIQRNVSINICKTNPIIQFEENRKLHKNVLVHIS